uniref:Ig-like domain-containing protein n=1 Tax=Gopherus agassizii TaxID=38772 RepID=A0A452H1Z2_9SAUR
RDWWWNVHCNLMCLELINWWSFRTQEGIAVIGMSPGGSWPKPPPSGRAEQLEREAKAGFKDCESWRVHYILFPLFDGFSCILFISLANPTPPSIFPLVPCCTKTDNAPPDTSLACLVMGYFPSPVEIKWNSGKVTQGVTTFPEVTVRNGRFTQSSLLIIPARPRQGNTYQCDVTHQGTATTESKKFPQECKTHLLPPASSLDPTIYLTKPSYEDVIKNSGHVTCLVLGYDLAASRIAWKVDGQVSFAVKTEPPKKNSNGTTSLVSSHPVSLAQWGQGTQFTCKVTTPCSGELTQDITMSNTGEEPWHLKGKDKLQVSLTLICEASGFYPAEISISWLKNNSPELKSSYNNGPVSGSVISKLEVSRSRWILGTSYSCLVAHLSSEGIIARSVNVHTGKTHLSCFIRAPKSTLHLNLNIPLLAAPHAFQSGLCLFPMCVSFDSVQMKTSFTCLLCVHSTSLLKH